MMISANDVVSKTFMPHILFVFSLILVSESWHLYFSVGRRRVEHYHELTLSSSADGPLQRFNLVDQVFTEASLKHDP